MFRLLPLNYWEAVKVIAKTNTVILLLLISPAVAISLAPVFQMFAFLGWHPTVVGIVPKCLVAMWASTCF